MTSRVVFKASQPAYMQEFVSLVGEIHSIRIRW
jgi:hypothetical protein